MKTKMSNMLFWACLSVVVLTPLSNDIFISGFPDMSRFFGTHEIGYVISIFLAGLASAQLFYGPLLDRFGRKPVLVVGLSIFVIGSAMTALMTDYTFFLLARFIQAVGVCSTISTAFAIIHDVKHGDKHAMVSAMSAMMAVIGVFPALAPLLGSVLTTLMGWQLNFYVLLGLGCFYLFFIAFFFHETQESKNLLAIKKQHIWDNYSSLCKKKCYMSYCTISALSYGAIFSYLTVAALFIMSDFGFSAMTLGWVSFVLGVTLFTCSILVPKLVKKIGLPKGAVIGTLFLAFGALLMMLCAFMWGSSIYTFVGPMAVVAVGVGFIRPIASSGAMLGIEKRLSGSASAGFSFLSFVGGTVCSAVASHLRHSVIHFACFILAVGLLAIVFAVRNYRRPVVVD
jgi:MFS transporter, DHA1 family, multidrug resistance protein